MIIDTTLNNKYDKIVEDVLDIKEEDFDIFVYSGLQLEQKIKEKLTPREKEVFFARHLGEKTTLKELGEKFKVSKESICQTDKRAERKIRHLFYMSNTALKQDKITKNFAELDYLIRKRIFENNNVIDNSIKQDFIDTYKYLVEEKINDKIHELTIKKAEELNDIDYSQIRVEDFEFSVRTYSILMRNGIKTLKQLEESFFEGKFEKFRNVGKKTMEEVYKKIIRFPEEYINSEEYKEKKVNFTNIYNHRKEKLKEKLKQFKGGLVVVNDIEYLDGF